MEIDDQSAALALGIGKLGALWHRHAILLGEELEGLVEREALNLHYKIEDIAFGAAAETDIKLMGRMNREGRRFFRMERAQTRVARPRFLETHVFPDDGDNVDHAF